MKRWLACLMLSFYLIYGGVAWAQPQIPPRPTTNIYVQDYAGVLSEDTKTRINSTSTQLAARIKAQIVVVTIPSLEGTPPAEYALALLRSWGVGDKTLNNGVVLLISVNDRQSRIEVAYGLEGPLPDAKVGRIQDDYMIPYFQQGDYDKGILNGYRAVASEVAKEYKLEMKSEAKPAQNNNNSSSWWDEIPGWAQILIAVGLLLLMVIDWMFFGGAITYLLLSIISRGGRGGGSGGSGFGGGSGGGGGSSRKW